MASPAAIPWRIDTVVKRFGHLTARRLLRILPRHSGDVSDFG